MSKEMTPLEAFKNILGGLAGEALYVENEIDIVETALKRLELLDTIEKLPMPEVEVLDNNKISYVGHDIVITDKEQFDKDQKKLKAFEIIKKIVKHDIEVNGNTDIPKYELNEVITQEEYDLLKEVLL